MTEYQQPGFPYRADPLNVHDAGLQYAKEFGTNVTDSLGDAFTTSVGAPDVPASINARMGALECDALSTATIPANNTPRGRTFLTPDFADATKFPPSPVLGPGITAAVIYAHVTLRLSESTVDPMASNLASLILAQEGFVGEQPGMFPFASFDEMGIQGVAGFVQANFWGTPTTPSPVAATQGIQGAYWCIQLITDNAKGTDLVAWASNDGLAWFQLVGPGQMVLPFLVRRMGLMVTGATIGQLDWLRIYSYVITSEGLYLPNPQMPETGGRLYIP